MSSKTLNLNDSLLHYIQSVSVQESEVLKQLRTETAKQPMAVMQIAPEQGQFMSFLVQVLNAKKTLEIGVFTGYSALVIALALPADGQVIACDISEEYTAIAQQFWQQAGVAEKIDLRIAPALETLDKLIAENHSNTFDFAFIDADKSNYSNYYEKALQLVRPGGVIAIDNVLWSGRVAEAEVQDNRTQKIREFNQNLAQDSRVKISLIPIADGLTLALKLS